MNNQELLQKIDNDLSKINANRDAHVDIQQIMDHYKKRVEMEAQVRQQELAKSKHKETE